LRGAAIAFSMSTRELKESIRLRMMTSFVVHDPNDPFIDTCRPAITRTVGTTDVEKEVNSHARCEVCGNRVLRQPQFHLQVIL
jgi:hypothetical protein